MRSYQKSIEFDQGDCLSFGNLASIYILKDLHADAIPLLLRGIELSQEGSATAHLWNQLGDAYRRLDDYDHAVAAYRKADELSYEKATERSEVSIPETDPQEAPSENLLAGSAKDLVLEPAKEDPSPSEVSAPAIPDQLYESFVPDEPDAIATKPDADFLGWLDGLASVLPVTPPSEMKAIDGSNPLGDDSMDAVKESETGDNELAYTADDQVLPDQNEASYSSVASADVLEEQIISNNFYEEPASFASDPSMETDVITDASSSSLSYHSLDNPADKETITYESALQVSRLDTEDTGQTQVSIDQKNAQIWNELGNIYYNTGAFEEAMHAFEMAIELDPYFGWSYNNLASIYVHQKKFTDAIPLYQKGLQYLDDDKDQALLWNRLGDAYRRLDDRSQAAAAYRKAMQLDPDNVSLLTRARFSLLGNRKA
jgi:tetratricopeptide (TPR) repeat protein